MAKKPIKLSVQVLYLLIMCFQLLILLVLLVPEFDVLVFLLFLLTSFSLVLRWRIEIKPIYMLIDQFVLIIVSLFYTQAIMYFFLLAYYFAYKNKLLYVIPSFIVGAINSYNEIFYLLFIIAILFGIILYLWEKESNTNKELSDNLRERIYELEQTQYLLLMDNQDTEKVSRLSERQRMAEILHDNLGHELTAAHLSLKASNTLLNQDHLEKAKITLKNSEKRLDNALHQLKSTVSSLEPINEFGYEQLKSLIDNYMYPINFKQHGDVSKLKPYIWQLINVSFKEAFTNIIKHANPNFINVELDVTDNIVRVIIENDGINKTGDTDGHGLRYMRNRIEAVGGSLSVQKTKTFKVIIIIPLND